VADALVRRIEHSSRPSRSCHLPATDPQCLNPGPVWLQLRCEHCIMLSSCLISRVVHYESMNLDHDQSTPKLMTKSGSDSCRDCTKLHCPQNVYILNHLGHCSQILRLHPWALNSGKYTGVPAFVSVPTLIQREGQPKLDVVTGCVFLISQPQTKHIGPRPCCRTICWRCTVPNHLNSSPRASGQKMIIYIYIHAIYIYMRYVCLYTCIYI
jgi:hypothetical protein